MRSLKNRIDSTDVLLAMEPEEIARHLLGTLQDSPGQNGQFILSNALGALAAGYDRSDEAAIAIAEAWAWLEGQAMLVPAPSQIGHAPWRILSRRARSLTAPAAYAAFRLSALLPKELLHPSIPQQVWPNFIRGDYDTATFQAMRQVEISLRDASGITDEPSGVRLARKAFHAETGPLTDPGEEGGEKEAIMNLFCGALGRLKNPHSHRNVQLENPADAAAAIMLASYLLRVIDDRSHASRD
ncbi:MAG: TIGR02391 family protein [Brevundimonas aurantiaca]|uniref:TIGR02391 family protein n=1 Tax=Brevundimonas aurantiaca TaxID=74316 RepID=UPI00391C8B5B